MSDSTILCVICAASEATEGFAYTDRFAGRPLIEHTICCALDCERLKNIMVISDDSRVESICSKYRLPFYQYSSEDQIDVAISQAHQIRAGAMWAAECFKAGYDLVVSLGPAAPLRTVADIYDALDLFTRSNREVLYSVVPIFSKGQDLINHDGDAKGLFQDRVPGISNPKDPPQYQYNGCIDIYSRSYLLATKAPEKQEIEFYFMPEYRGWAIRNRFDFFVAESIYQNWAKFYFTFGYSEYWEKRTTSENTPSDKTATETNFVSYFERAIRSVESDSKHLLDLGCGFGRFFPIYVDRGFDIYGVDISQEMINKAFQYNRTRIRELRVESLESFDFPDNFFDVVVVWAVFDATQQKRVMQKILRVLKVGGVAIVTGKNHDYFADDKAAIIAEEMARQKGHPNYFTDYESMKSWVLNLGGYFAGEYFFLRRGDFGDGRSFTKQPDKFYEWCAFIKKISACARESYGQDFSSVMSSTFQSVKEIS